MSQGKGDSDVSKEVGIENVFAESDESSCSVIDSCQWVRGKGIRLYQFVEALIQDLQVKKTTRASRSRCVILSIFLSVYVIFTICPFIILDSEFILDSEIRVLVEPKSKPYSTSSSEIMPLKPKLEAS
ncbi:hypothetical protein L1887_09129 [Cichorium endivia]|nr:hypothetical protein L1887_09129 [Cichorium endivia]